MLFLTGNTNKALSRRYTRCFGRTGGKKLRDLKSVMEEATEI